MAVAAGLLGAARHLVGEFDLAGAQLVLVRVVAGSAPLLLAVARAPVGAVARWALAQTRVSPFSEGLTGAEVVERSPREAPQRDVRAQLHVGLFPTLSHTFA